jgi:hypothetical protein
MKKSKFILLLLYIVLCVNTFAIDKTLSRDRVLEVANELSIKDYPNAHELLLDNLVYLKYDINGKSEMTDDVYIKILDEVGKQENSSLKFYYNNNYSRKELVNAEIIKLNGDIFQININENIIDQVAPGNAASNIYDDDSRLLTLKVPKLEIGDILHYVLKEESFKPRIENHFSDFFLGQYTMPFKKATVFIEAPEEKPLLNHKVLDSVENHYKISEERKDGKIFYRFEVNNVPQIITEGKMPPLSKVAMRYLVTTIPDWGTISRWYFELCEPKMIITEAMKNKTIELTKDSKNEIEKIEKIFFFVSRKVRYMGVTTETNRPGLEPHATDYTFDTMTGVCRDKAALIVVMLRELGFDANMVLINTSRKLDVEVPLSYFNHAIAGVKLSNGEIILLDPTDETTKDFLPQYEMDKTYLMATKKGETLKLTPIIHADENKLISNTEFRIKESKLFGKSTIKFTGLNDNIYRHAFAKRSKSENKKLLKRLLKKLSSDIKLDNFEILPEKLLDDSQTLELKLEYTINDSIIKKDEYEILYIPNLGDVFGAHNWLPGDLSLEKRNYPLISDFTASLFEKVDIYIDKDYKMELIPENFELKKDAYTHSYKYSIEDNKISYERYNAMKKLEYSNLEYNLLRDIFRRIQNYRKKYIILKK